MAAVFLTGFFLGHFLDLGENSPLLSPFSANEAPELPLLQYTIPSLAKQRFLPSPIIVEKTLDETADFTSYLFSYTSTDRKITGQLNVPNQLLTANQSPAAPIIILVRGYVDQAEYETGVGTQNAAAVFAQNGYVTLAPDFLGFGESDPEPADVWEARFIKPINLIELITSLKANPTLQTPLPTPQAVDLDYEKIGLWAHSNGGQIALTALEVLGEPIPATLWAPVTAPFPYSILFFTDENEDEGKEARAWIAQFERDYDAREFSLTQYLDRLTGSLQLHHGTADENALQIWSEEFVGKIAAENTRRTSSTETELPEIELEYFTYPGADHNLLPGWDLAIQRDLTFFNTLLR